MPSAIRRFTGGSAESSDTMDWDERSWAKASEVGVASYDVMGCDALVRGNWPRKESRWHRILEMRKRMMMDEHALEWSNS